MYALVVARPREMGTLRALGFSKVSILTAFVVLMGVAGGVLPAFRAARMPITSAFSDG